MSLTKTEKEMINSAKQVWARGFTVRVGFLSLVVVDLELTPHDGMPDAYILRNKTGDKFYRFVPHNGLESINAPDLAS